MTRRGLFVFLAGLLGVRKAKANTVLYADYVQLWKSVQPHTIVTGAISPRGLMYYSHGGKVVETAFGTFDFRHISVVAEEILRKERTTRGIRDVITTNL